MKNEYKEVYDLLLRQLSTVMNSKKEFLKTVKNKPRSRAYIETKAEIKEIFLIRNLMVCFLRGIRRERKQKGYRS